MSMQALGDLATRVLGVGTRRLEQMYGRRRVAEAVENLRLAAQNAAKPTEEAPC